MNQIEVQIMGQSYILGCPPGAEQRFHTSVRKVDEAMCKIRDAGKIKARDRIAVLAALNLAFELSDFSAAPSEPSTSHHNLQNLLHRLDTTLGHDGHLL
ncbi:MAG: cell division protein ZapA [Betaproteobacteria bacterium]|nr:cell division protein ZapA [Betaproteobacteria bacterium]